MELPHKEEVTAIEFQATASELILATAGSDECFKIWSLQDSSTIYSKLFFFLLKIFITSYLKYLLNF